MFAHITTLLSFVYALALTHLLSTATELVLARDRVRGGGLHVLWMLIALVSLFTNWLAVRTLSGVKLWTLGEILLQFSTAMIQYFTCSLLSVRLPDEATFDLSAHFVRQRIAILAPFAAFLVIAAVGNYLDRSVLAGVAPGAWLTANLLIAPMLAMVIVAMVARPRWLQWIAGLAYLGLEVAFVGTYTPTA